MGREKTLQSQGHSRSPVPQPFPGSWANVAPKVWTFDRMVQARYVRVGPHPSHHSEVSHRTFQWAELLGCGPGKAGLRVG